MAAIGTLGVVDGRGGLVAFVFGSVDWGGVGLEFAVFEIGGGEGLDASDVASALDGLGGISRTLLRIFEFVGITFGVECDV